MSIYTGIDAGTFAHVVYRLDVREDCKAILKFDNDLTGFTGLEKLISELFLSPPIPGYLKGIVQIEQNPLHIRPAFREKIIFSKKRCGFSKIIKDPVIILRNF